MKKIESSNLQFDILRGGFTALINSWIGCLVFVISDLLRKLIIYGGKIDLPFLVFAFITCCVIAFVPAFLGGGVLAYSIRQNVINGNYSKRMVIIKGSLLGILCGLGISLIVWSASCFIGHGCPDNSLFLYRTTVATLLATIFGGFTGISLFIFFRGRTSPA